MTKQELILMINTAFENSNNGNLDKDTIYLLGLMHRQLDKSEKNWKWFAEQINYQGNSENLRKYISKRLKRESTVLSDDDLEEKKEEVVIEQNATQNSEDNDYETKLSKLLKQQQKVRDWTSVYRRYLRDDSRIDSLKDAIKEAVGELHALPSVQYRYNPEKPRHTEAILMLSDLHLGTVIDNFANKYDEDVAIRRVNNLVNDVINYCYTFNVERLNIVNLGDLIAGIIHTTIRLDQQFDVITQVMKAGEILANALNRLQSTAKEVIYRSVSDNHARVMANKNEAIEKENFGRLIDWFLQERLKDTKIKFMFDNLDVSLGKFKLLNDQVVMFSHGHLDSKNCVFQNYVGATKEFVDYILLGHYHNFEIKSFQQCRVFINGSIVGTDGYATSRRLFGKPSQTLLIFDNIKSFNPNVISIDIALGD